MLTYKEYITEGLRLLHTVGNGNRTAKIYRDVEWDEHRVKFFKDGVHQKEADYHTNDKEDAHHTANHWINQQTESVVTSTNVGKFFPKKKVVDGVTINPTIADPKNKNIEEENLDEISKDTLTSYIGKAVETVPTKQSAATAAYVRGKHGEAHDRQNNTDRRVKNIQRAAYRLQYPDNPFLKDK